MARKKAEPPPGYAQRLRVVLASPLGRVLLRATGVALLLLVGGVVMRQARAQAYAMPEYRLTPAEIQFAELPDWVDADIERDLANTRRYPGFSTSIFDPDAEANVRAAVSAHPLVHSVSTVDVSYPKGVRVLPVLRRPIATVTVPVRERYIKARGATAVRVVKRRRVLGDDGSLLPVTPYASYLKRLRVPLPEVRGIKAAAPRLGNLWEDRHGQVAEGVVAACVAQRIYRETQGRVQVTVVDVSRFPSPGDSLVQGEVRFHAILRRPGKTGASARRISIEWGRTERDCRETPDEDCYDMKIARLKRALRRRIGRTLDVRFADDEG